MDVNKIIKEWNKVADKKFDNRQDWLLDIELQNMDRRITEDMMIEAIHNFKTARDLRVTQAWSWNLFHFIRRGYKNYLPGVFDIDHFNGRKFGKKPPPLTHEQQIELSKKIEQKRQQKVREEMSGFFKEKTTEELKEMRNSKIMSGDWFLIDEILKQRKGGGK